MEARWNLLTGGECPPVEVMDGAEGFERRITLLIADDHRLLTDSLAMVVEGESDIELVSAPVDDPAAAIDLVRTHRPDVVLMDVSFKGALMNGFDATRRIKETSPATNVIIMTASDDESSLVQGVESGAAGFLNKTEAVDEVLDAVRGALQHVAKDREEQRQAGQLLGQLTERELEVLRLLAQGIRNDGIAGRLFISQQTVQTHVRNILAKLRVHSKLEAVVFAVRHGAVQV